MAYQSNYAKTPRLASSSLITSSHWARGMRTSRRIFSSFLLDNGTQLWVITEAADEHGQREVTTLLLPEDY